MSRNRGNENPTNRDRSGNRASNQTSRGNRSRHQNEESELFPSNHRVENGSPFPTREINRQVPINPQTATSEYQPTFGNSLVNRVRAPSRVDNDDPPLFTPTRMNNRPMLPRTVRPPQTIATIDPFVPNQTNDQFEQSPRHVINSASASTKPDINILMCGPTGDGKSTLINGLINYMAYDTLDTAKQSEMLVVIPSSYVYFTDEGDNRRISLGQPNQYEHFSCEGQSSTQECRAFVINIGHRILRIIDTPGLGDTRGIEQDARNLKEIFGTIAQYKHLSAICIILKPNQQRLSKNFEYCVNEILRHLPTSARNNINFIFTHARETFYKPGSTKILLEKLLKNHFEEQHAEIPLNSHNTFLFENGSFRYLALTQAGIQLSDEETESYEKGWNHSVNESLKFLTRVLRSPLHDVQDTISLNNAEQLIRNLPRPLAEIQRQIAANLDRAQKFKEAVLNDSQIIDDGIPQLEGHVEELDHPQTVAIPVKSRHLVNRNDRRRVEIQCICHEKCSVKGVQQEFMGDENLELCEVMNPDSGLCQICGSSWRYHMHITYKYTTGTTRIRTPHGRLSETGSPLKLTLADIDRRIMNLRAEAEQIENVYKQLAEYLQANSLLLFDNAFVKYLEYFIEEEKQKRDISNENNMEVIKHLQGMKKDFEEHVKRLQSVLGQLPNADRNKQCTLKPQDIVHLVQRLYQLPINGRSIRNQVEIIGMAQARLCNRKEQKMQLPRQSNNSRVMNDLMHLFS